MANKINGEEFFDTIRLVCEDGLVLEPVLSLEVRNKLMEGDDLLMEKIRETKTTIVLPPTSTPADEMVPSSTSKDVVMEKRIKWDHNATLALIEQRKEKEDAFNDPNNRNKKHLIWGEIATELKHLMSDNLIGKQCENRWKVLMRDYKEVKDLSSDNGKEVTGRATKTFAYEQQLDDMYGLSDKIKPRCILESLKSAKSKSLDVEMENQSSDVDTDNSPPIEINQSINFNKRKRKPVVSPTVSALKTLESNMTLAREAADRRHADKKEWMKSLLSAFKGDK